VNTQTSYKVLGMCGSLRQKSFNMAALRTAGGLMPPALKLEITGIGDLPLYNADIQDKGLPEAVTRLRDEIFAADALLFGTSENNWSVPAVLKNAIDWMSRLPQQPFQNKPAAVFSCSGGPVGGARVQYDLRRILSGLGVLWLARPEVFIGNAASKFTDGKLTDETTLKFLTDQMLAFEDWIRRMKRAFP